MSLINSPNAPHSTACHSLTKRSRRHQPPRAPANHSLDRRRSLGVAAPTRKRSAEHLPAPLPPGTSRATALPAVPGSRTASVDAYMGSDLRRQELFRASTDPMRTTYRYLAGCQLPGSRASLVQPSNIGLEEVFVTVTSGRVPAHLLSQASAEKWQTVGSALMSWRLTIRFCLILLIMNIPVACYALLALTLMTRR